MSPLYREALQSFRHRMYFFAVWIGSSKSDYKRKSVVFSLLIEVFFPLFSPCLQKSVFFALFIEVVFFFLQKSFFSLFIEIGIFCLVYRSRYFLPLISVSCQRSIIHAFNFYILSKVGNIFLEFLFFVKIRYFMLSISCQKSLFYAF